MQTLSFLCAWTWLDLVFNLRYPGPAPLALALLPSLDVTALLAVLALCGWWRRPLSPWISTALGVAAVVIRIFRFGDGVSLRYFNRPLELALDLPLSSELPRLLDSTVSRVLLVPGALLLVGALVGLGAISILAVRRLASDLADERPRRLFAAIVLGAGLLSLALPRSSAPGLRVGAFGASLAPVAASQLAAWRALGTRRVAARGAIAAADGRLRAMPRGLERLHGANVFIFLVESYGETVLARPELARHVLPAYRAFETSLAAGGFSVASGLLASPTYAGRSWLAQETLAAGVEVGDHVVDTEIQRARPMTMARLFREAGYRTVFVQPGSTHPELVRWSYDFDRVYSAWDLPYRGPAFRWAPMPDQYVIDFTHRREVAPATGPLLIEYALVSSHAPWSDQPGEIADWEEVGDGTAYRTLAGARFPIGWLDLSRAATAYAHAIVYDLDVLAAYVTRYVPGDSLVLILGDHQPVAEITRFSPSHAVPVHVISRSPALVQAFLARGYQRGMLPLRTAHPRGLDTLLPDLVADFSAPGVP